MLADLLGAQPARITCQGATYLVAGTGNDIVIGSPQGDTLTGGGGFDTVLGGRGADVLSSVSGPESLYGGAGADLIVMSSAQFPQVEVFGGTGTDTLLFAREIAPAPVAGFSYDPSIQIERIAGSLQGSDGGQVFDFGDWVVAGMTIVGGTGDDIIALRHGEGLVDGGNGDDTIYAVESGSTLSGGHGHDLLYGSAGDDVFTATGLDLEDDTIFGGGGNDHLVLVAWPVRIHHLDVAAMGIFSDMALGGGQFRGGAGDDLIDLGGVLVRYGNAAISLDGHDGNDTLGAPDLPGVQAVTLHGGSGNDLVLGHDGTDILDGGTGADTMEGGLGDDEYFVDNRHDVVTEVRGGGVQDAVVTSLRTVRWHAAIEVYVIVGARDDTVFGDKRDNRIILGAGPGDDVIYSRAGNDRITSDADCGQHLLAYGGAGKDEIFAETAQAQLYGGAGKDYLSGGTQGDVIYGGNGDDRIFGGGGNDTLYGGAGNDVLEGGAGNDLYVVQVGDVVGSFDGRGQDTVVADFLVWTMGQDIEDFVSTASAGIRITGNAMLNHISGTAFDDQLVGATKDTLIGGAGNDIYVVSGRSVVVLEIAHGGHDLVQATTSYIVLSPYVEDLVLYGTYQSSTHHNTAIGNDLDNVIRTYFGNYLIVAGAGDDTVRTGEGNDTVTGGDGNDVFVMESFKLDTFTDFTPGGDILVLGIGNVGPFTNLSPGQLSAGAFHVIGQGSEDASDRILYDQLTGALYFDPDGIASASAVQFAQLSDHPILTAADIWVI